MQSSDAGQPRLRKRPHRLHLCTSVGEVAAELRARGVDLVSLVYEFIRPTARAGILVTGSIADGVATEVSDLDLLVLLPGQGAWRPRLPREIAGNVVRYLPPETPGTTYVTLFLSGIEIDLAFVVNPEIAESPETPATPANTGGVRSGPEAAQELGIEGGNPFLNRLGTGWIVHGQEVVQRWREHYQTGKLRTRWIATAFTAATKTLEDMRAGIGLAPGHVAAIGVHSVTLLLIALLGGHDFYCTSPNWMLKIDQLRRAGNLDPAMRDALLAGAALAFPTMLANVDEEWAYFEQVCEYARTVRELLAREEGMGELLAAIVHDFDIVL